jgi:hypothetical protein
MKNIFASGSCASTKELAFGHAPRWPFHLKSDRAFSNRRPTSQNTYDVILLQVCPRIQDLVCYVYCIIYQN